MKRGDKAQMKLSFGMIFSIILIVIFIAFAFYVIKMLIQSQEQGLTLLFKEDLQEDVDKIWGGSGSLSRPDGYALPKKIEYACFVDYSSPKKGLKQEFYTKLKQAYYGSENFFFYPVGSAQGLDATEIKHIDIEKITEVENPYCIQNINGKVKLTIKRDYSEELVLIERQ